MLGGVKHYMLVLETIWSRYALMEVMEVLTWTCRKERGWLSPWQELCHANGVGATCCRRRISATYVGLVIIVWANVSYVEGGASKQGQRNTCGPYDMHVGPLPRTLAGYGPNPSKL